MPRLYIQFLAPTIITTGMFATGLLLGQPLIGLSSGVVCGILLGVVLAHRASSRLVAAVRTLQTEFRGEEELVSVPGFSDEIDNLARVIDRFIELDRVSIEVERREHSRQIQLLDRMHDGVMRIDAQGVISYSNVAAGAVFGGRNPVERSFLAVTHDHEFNDLLVECLNTGIEQQVTVDSPISGRTINAVLVRMSDQPPEALVVLRDVTELTRLQTLRRDFVANVSHELRTPLSTIKILTETLITLIVEEEQKRFLHKIDAEVNAMTDLVDELLTLARLQSRAPELNLSVVEVATVLDSVRDRTLPLVEQEEIDLIVQQPIPPDLEIEVDERRILQALLNLVHNAIHHTSSGGQVELSAMKGDGFVQFSVSDTGTGIMPEDLNRIWERFYKADRSRSKSGSGLGLAIVKYIVQAHGGDVEATSQPGKGSEFRISVPLVQDHQTIRRTVETETAV